MNGRRIMAFWDLIHPMMSDSKSVDDILAEAEELSLTDHETSVGVVLPKLLAEELLLQELRVRKPVLVRFLSRSEVIEALVGFVVAASGDGSGDVCRTSFEILNYPDDSMMSTIVDVALERLLTFLKTPCDVDEMATTIDRVCRLLTTYIHRSPSQCHDAFERYDAFNEFVDACCGGGHLSGNEHVYSLFVKGFLKPEGSGGNSIGSGGVMDALSLLVSSSGDDFDESSVLEREDPALRLQYNNLLSKQDFVDRLAFQLLETKKLAELSQANVAELLVMIANDKSRNTLYTDLCGWTDTFIAEAFALIPSEDELDLERIDNRYGYFLRSIFKILSLVASNTYQQQNGSDGSRLDSENYCALVKRGYPRHRGSFVRLMLSPTRSDRPSQSGQQFCPCTETRIQAIRLHSEMVRLMIRKKGEENVQPLIALHTDAIVNLFANYGRCDQAHQIASGSFKAIAKDLDESDRRLHTKNLRERLLNVWKHQTQPTMLSKFIDELFVGEECDIGNELGADLVYNEFKTARMNQQELSAKYKSLASPEDLINSLYGADDEDNEISESAAVERSQPRRIFDFMIEHGEENKEPTSNESQSSFERLFNFNLVGTGSNSNDDDDDEFEGESNSSGSSEGDDVLVLRSPSDDEDETNGENGHDDLRE